MTHPGGRPSDYREEYCQTVIEIGKNGGSVNSMAVACDVEKKNMLNWAIDHSEFRHALNKAKQLSQDWWEKMGQQNLITENGRSLNSGVYNRSMAARFPDDWRDNSKHEIVGKDNSNLFPNLETMSEEQLQKRLELLRNGQA